jgi:hypothetical protein
MRLGSNQYVSFLLDRTRVTCRQEGYSSSTEKRYLYWVRRFLNDVEVAVPKDLRPESARAFLRTLQDYTYPTKNQARNALSFFFDEVLAGPIGEGVEWGFMPQMRSSLGTEAGTAEAGRPFARLGRASSPHRPRTASARWRMGAHGQTRP